MSLKKIWETVTLYKRLIVAAPFACGGLALLFCLLSPRLWEASATLQIGQTWYTGLASVTQGEMKQLVEPPAQTVARVLNPSFVNELVGSETVATPDRAAAERHLRGSLFAKIRRGTDLVEIKLRAASRSLALSLMEEAVVLLQKKHFELLNPILNKLQAERSNLDKATKSTQTEIELIQKRLYGKASWSSAEMILFSVVLQNRQKDLIDFQQKLLNLDEQLSPMRTFQTRQVGLTFSAESPVAPQTVVVVIASALVGLFVAAVAAFAHRAITHGPLYSETLLA